MKSCSICKTVKSMIEFFKQIDMIDGYRNQCKACRAEYKRISRKKSPEAHRQSTKRWKVRNPSKVRSMSAKRRADLLQRVPKWADLKAIHKFYTNCPPGYHVDHIIPLCGKNVSGLHVLNNLQYLSKQDNLRKYNKVI